MKFWKQILITASLFTAVAATVFYSSCEKDTCNNVSCKNGGSCGNGTCKCPTGYENAECQDKSVTRFVGTFAGYTECNNGAQVIDTAFIYADSTSEKTVDYVWVQLNSISPTILHGYVQTNESNYSIIIPEVTATNYYKIYTITLQSNKSLTIYSYEQDERTPGDTIINKCNFVGFKQQ